MCVCAWHAPTPLPNCWEVEALEISTRILFVGSGVVGGFFSYKCLAIRFEAQLPHISLRNEKLSFSPSTSILESSGCWGNVGSPLFDSSPDSWLLNGGECVCYWALKPRLLLFCFFSSSLNTPLFTSAAVVHSFSQAVAWNWHDSLHFHRCPNHSE